MGFGREGAICEYIEIMQILPGSSDDARLINASRAFGKMAGRQFKRGKLHFKADVLQAPETSACYQPPKNDRLPK